MASLSHRIRPDRFWLTRGKNLMQRILVIDDESSIRNILSMMLKNLGYDVVVATDGEEGIRLFRKPGNFDLVITDIRMPNIDGNELGKYIRDSEQPSIPLVAITGYPEEVQKNLFDFSLEKPFKLKDLIRVVTSLERNRR
jgi:CheY-like chemotaxis protein